MKMKNATPMTPLANKRNINTVLLYPFKLWMPGKSATPMATTTPTVKGVNTVVDIMNAGKTTLQYRLGIHRK